MITWNVELGCFDDKISNQLKKENISFDPETIKELQKDVDSINRLYVRNYISATTTIKLRNKIFKELVRIVGK